MELILSEEQCKTVFENSKTLYNNIIESLYSKAIKKANDKVFAKYYFFQLIEAELEFQKGFDFINKFIETYELYNKLGLSWFDFLREVRIMQTAYTYNQHNSSIREFAQLNTVFTRKEIKRIEIESQLLNVKNRDKSIYDFVKCNLLEKSRDIDFIKYIAKHITLSNYTFSLRNTVDFKDDSVKADAIKVKNKISWTTTKGKKIELIRLLIALNDCKYFETIDGQIPSQEELMNYFGELLSVNLKNYEQDLSNGFESRLHTNITIFEKLKLAIEKRFNQKVEQK